MWQEATINLEQLCDGDLNKPLQIELWDYEDNGKNRIVAKLKDKLTLNILMSKSENLRGNADRRKALALEECKEYKIYQKREIVELLPAGEIIVLKAQLNY